MSLATMCICMCVCMCVCVCDTVCVCVHVVISLIYKSVSAASSEWLYRFAGVLCPSFPTVL